MQVFKFGGASVKDAESVKNVGAIIQRFGENNLVVVVSAMGKTTNALEEVYQLAQQKEVKKAQVAIQVIADIHKKVISDLLTQSDEALSWLEDEKTTLLEFVEQEHINLDAFNYDQIVSKGEFWSTKIIHYYLNEQKIINTWLDASSCIRTNSSHKEGKVDWQITEKAIQDRIKSGVYITQGFIGSDGKSTVTLGREGSDYSAAIFAYCLNAHNVTIWKDVEGLLNADPKWFNPTELIPKISFKEAIELSYYGASVIHPKTIQPLQNKNIPLYVKSFVNPDKSGTIIQRDPYSDHLVPSFIFKMNQTLLSITTRDFSFIVEENLEEIFGYFHSFGVKINLMQNSAINFSVSIDTSPKAMALIESLQEKYQVLYNEGMELITIRHFDETTIKRVMLNKELYLEQKTRHTCRLLVKDLG